MGSGLHTSQMSEKPRALRPGKLAALAGISTDTLRHYERLGILPDVPRTASGYRLYPPDSLGRVTLVRHALQLGFTLKELADILRARDNGGVPCKRVLEMLRQKLDVLADRIAELQKTQKYMQSLTREWSSRLSQTPLGSKAFLLRSLGAKPAPRKRVRPELKGRKHA
jgi:MerR family copper efflux transcriptional regulator